MTYKIVQAEVRWPEKPYRGLTYYGPEDQPLYAGRDADIQRCSALLLSSTTRTLILHGATGCGKSSFLRAGLIPMVEAEGFLTRFHRQDPNNRSSKVVFIRCTNAPLIQLAEEVFRIASTPLIRSTKDGIFKVELSEVLDDKTTLEAFREASRERGYGFIVHALSRIAKLLPMTLILVLDQAEEVLTLNRDEEASSNRREFFYFLQDFNAVPIDLKLVISLRTEFYGRFYNAMNLTQQVRSDARQYLLEDFNRDMLLQAIERPTLSESVDLWPAPIEKYMFRFRPGLAEQIANDLMAAKQADGVLSVMQIVCKSLYELSLADGQQVERGGIRTITDRQYVALGRVHGSIDDLIGKLLRQTFLKLGLPTNAYNSEERRWRQVLCSLLIVQQDGTVTTNALPAAKFEEVARREEVVLPFRSVVNNLLAPDVVLLRQLALVDKETGVLVESYSLGHDVLGLALHRWRESDRGFEVHRQQLRLRNLLASASVLFILVLLAGVYWHFWSLNREETFGEAQRLVRQSRTIGKTDFRLGLLLAVAANRTVTEKAIKYSSDELNGPDGPLSGLYESLVASPEVVIKLRPPPSATPTHVSFSPMIFPSSSSRVSIIPSGEHILVAGTDGAFALDLSDSEASITDHYPTRNEPPDIKYAFWSQDGKQPLLMSASELVLTTPSAFVSVSSDRLSLILTGSKNEDYEFRPFGWERVLLEPSRGFDRASLRSSQNPPMFRVGRPVGKVILTGNRSALLALSPQKNFAVDIVLQDIDRETPLRIEESNPASGSSIGGIAELLSRMGVFSPDDTAVIVTISNEHGTARLMRLAVPNWEAHQLASCDIPFGPSLPVHLAIGPANANIVLATVDSDGRLELRSVVRPAVLKQPCKFVSTPLSAQQPTSGQQMVVAPEFYGSKGLQSLAFTQSGTRLAGISEDGILLIWDTNLRARKIVLNGMKKEGDAAAMIAKACKLADRDMTDEEKQIYLGNSMRVCP